jgi:hypothetical protein
MSAAAPTTQPDPAPSRSGRLLALIRKLIDYGKEVAATIQRVATDPRAVISRFGTADLPTILACIARGLHRARALEERVLRRAAWLDREPRPAKPRPGRREAADAPPCRRIRPRPHRPPHRGTHRRRNSPPSHRRGHRRHLPRSRPAAEPSALARGVRRRHHEPRQPGPPVERHVRPCPRPSSQARLRRQPNGALPGAVRHRPALMLAPDLIGGLAPHHYAGCWSMQ